MMNNTNKKPTSIIDNLLLVRLYQDGFIIQTPEIVKSKVKLSRKEKKVKTHAYIIEDSPRLDEVYADSGKLEQIKEVLRLTVLGLKQNGHKVYIRTGETSGDT